MIPFLFLTCLAGSAAAQNGDLFSSVAMRFLSYPANYLKPLDTLLSFQSTIGKDARMRPRFFNELATYSSFIGNYRDALRYYDSAGFREQVPASPSGPDAFSGYRPASARQTIIRMAASRQVTIINEAHHVPYHRLFTKSLLQELYNAGYRYLALETLGSFDDELNNRKYPVAKDGYYSHEPLYADMVRTALNIGYRLVSYEFNGSCTGREDCIMKREQHQAEQLHQVLQKDPAAKMLVHVGYSHLREAPLNGIEWMAARFKKLSGIDPLTINQEFMRETFNPALQHPAYNTAMKLFKLQEPSVFVKADSLWNFAPADRSCDILVFHPPYGMAQGRPDYYRLDATRKPVTVRLKKAYDHVMIQAYIAAEKDAGRLPADQLLLERGNEARLMLAAGEYDVVVRDGEGEILEIKTVTVQ
ncbi:hypothetical protein DLD77_01655 [Chitinophaga alhagiae]|uniref:Uncharacterized protein n=1 Tax=Chitinophaga alhagiae TaxID=2203219 RepID=A0ABN5LM99_9BACT|nr:hypothetical protein DLD77_01655 [Chitinophaga alhagiae]